MTALRIPVILAALVAATPALAHSGHGEAGGLIAGFLHPLTGFDHLLAMLAVGLWAALLGGRALSLWPLAFVAAMIAGFALATAGVALPLHEPMIMASLIGLGLVIALAVPVPVAAGAGLIALFGLFHGHAHGLEVSGAVAAFASGFAAASLLLHLAGIGLALVIVRTLSVRPVQAAGAAIALAGVVLLTKDFVL